MAPGTKRWLVAIPGVVGIALGSFALYRTANQSEVSCVAFAEPIDPLSSQHLLPDATEPHYLSNPPTSGAHKPGLYPTGLVKITIPRPVQVTLLEQGEVLVQYQDVSKHTLSQLRGVASAAEHVTVAPNASLSSKIVATAWLWKMTCSSFDATALHDFISAHQPVQPVSK